MHFYHLKFLEQVLDVKQIESQIMVEHGRGESGGSGGEMVKDEFDGEEDGDGQEQNGYDDLNEDLDSEGMLTGLDAYNSYQIRSDDGEENGDDAGDSPDWNQEPDDPEEDNNQYDYNQYIQQQQRQLLAQKRQHYRLPQQDDDITHFFKSILPFLKMMEPARKLKIRLDIQELILNEMTKMNSKNTKRKKTENDTRISGKFACEKNKF